MWLNFQLHGMFMISICRACVRCYLFKCSITLTDTRLLLKGAWRCVGCWSVHARHFRSSTYAEKRRMSQPDHGSPLHLTRLSVLHLYAMTIKPDQYDCR